jgi:hypothetical protein
MPRKPTPPPETELAVVRDLTAQLAKAEAEVKRIRRERNKAMVTAKRAGATGDHLADAADIARRNVPAALHSGGLDTNDET